MPAPGGRTRPAPPLAAPPLAAGSLDAGQPLLDVLGVVQLGQQALGLWGRAGSQGRMSGSGLGGLPGACGGSLRAHAGGSSECWRPPTHTHAQWAHTPCCAPPPRPRRPLPRCRAPPWPAGCGCAAPRAPRVRAPRGRAQAARAGPARARSARGRAVRACAGRRWRGQGVSSGRAGGVQVQAEACGHASWWDVDEVWMGWGCPCTSKSQVGL